jgi:hypothetical protein
MRPHRLRAFIVPGAIAIACAAALPVQMATAAPVTKGPGGTTTPANGGFYGVWTLQSWNIGGQVLPCPVQLPLGPGAPSIGCGPATYLKLFRSGRYDTNLPVFEANEADEGAFVVADMGPKKGNIIVFDDDGEADIPRAYRLVVPKSGSKAPTKMVISLAMVHGGVKTTYAMNFVRYTG